MDTTKTLTHVSLCAGYGGIDLGLSRAIGNLRTIAFSEIEAYPCSNLVAKMEAGLLDLAPIWTDLKTFPWGEFRDRVDILSGGYPCQPFSAAGKRLGKDDPRHLWPWIADGVVLMRPRLVFFENVEGHISLGLREVIGDLESLGYKATWGIFSASEVGAPHQRKRVFIMAYDSRNGYDWRALQDRIRGRSFPQLPQPHLGGRTEVRSKASGCSHDTRELAFPGGIGSEAGIPRQEQGQEGITGIAHDHRVEVWPSRPGEPQHGWEPPRVVGSVPKKLADFCSRDSQPGGDSSSASGEGAGAWGESPDAMPDRGSSLCGGDQGNEPPRVVGNSAKQGLPISGGESGSLEQPGTESQSQRSDSVVGNSERLRLESAAQESGHSEVAGGETQPSLGGNLDGSSRGMGYAELCISCDNRTDELRMLGNGVVPATAERAFTILLSQLINE